MSDDPLRPYLDDFEERLTEAADRSSRQRASRRIALVGAAVAALAAALILLLTVAGGSGGRLDVVAKARAALADRGRLVHLVTHERVLAPSGARIPGPRRFAFGWEEWATGNPPQWRIAYSYKGGYQLAFGHRTWSLYEQRRNRLMIERGFPTRFARTIPSTTSVLFGKAANGPIATIRAMLRRGELRDDGFASIGGQRVRRLVGERPAYPGGVAPRTRVAVRYYVDPDSYTPVAARIGRRPRAAGGSQAHGPGGYTRIRFTSFERLPLTAANARLLQVRPAGHPKVTQFRSNRGIAPIPPPAG
jgi:hypothetical protein